MPRNGLDPFVFASKGDHRMRILAFVIASFAMLSFAVHGQEKPAKQDYKDFSKLVHSMVVKELPKEVEDTSGWGGTIPYEPNLRLQRLRTVFKVGDKLEFPHG